jgi:predicted ArsR family transcriptional regulator
MATRLGIIAQMSPGTQILEKKIRDFLYDYGPHEVPDIAKAVNLSLSRTRFVLDSMALEGTISLMKRGKPIKRYWILAEDLEEEQCQLN